MSRPRSCYFRKGPVRLHWVRGWAEARTEWNGVFDSLNSRTSCGCLRKEGYRPTDDSEWSNVLEGREHESRKNRTKWVLCALVKSRKLSHKIAWALVHSCKILHNAIPLVSLDLDWMKTFWQECLLQTFIELILCARWNVSWSEITN